MKLAEICSTTAVAMTCATALIGAEQSRRQPPGPAMVPMEVSLKIGGEPYDARGQGSCTHAPKASIYDVSSEMWTVRHEESARSMQLTLWKPSNGSAAMISMSVSGKNNLSISTVRGGQVEGSGSATLAPSAKGGTFTVDAKGKAGEVVTGTIKCEAFTPAIDEGGN